VRVLFFGTYDLARHPRALVLAEGLAAHGDDVTECNVPLGLDTSWRVRILQKPWLLPVLGARMGASWTRLWRMARRLGPTDAVVIGYMGHFDVHLARRLWRKTPVVLDHLVFAADTARDRGVSSSRVNGVLERLDASALRAADVICVDTEEHGALVPSWAQDRVVVVPVGAPTRWFHRPSRREAGPLEVVFFGLFTPVQGAPTIGQAIGLLADRPIRFTLVGSGQQLEETRAAAAANGNVTWRAWVDAEELPKLVAANDVCLGIFGTSAKAGRAVPNKVYQGAAAGTAVVTSDTPPQRRALGDAAVLVPAGDPEALAEALAELAADEERLWALREAAYALAEAAFRPEKVTEPLRERLLSVVGS
jgi:glycosyltransferase involved in cell wall biosynthesis